MSHIIVNCRAIIVLLTMILFVLSATPSVFAPTIPEDSWTYAQPAPFEGRNQAVVLNNKIYVLTNSKNLFFEYDPATNVWTQKTSMPTSRWTFAICACENKVYVIGGVTKSLGYGSDLTTGVTEAYDPQTDTWETKAEMPTKRAQMNAETVNGKIYVISGETGGMRTEVDVTEVYDPNTDSWTTKTPIPTPRVLYASAVMDNKIHVIRNGHQIYDTETDTWCNGALVPKPAYTSAAACATTGTDAPKRIYVVGGDKSFASAMDLVYSYDPASDAWTKCACLQIARMGHGVAVVNDLVYAISGATDFVTATPTVERYRPFEYGTIPATIGIIYPETKTYTTNEIPLEFTINKPITWMGYSLDGKNNVTVFSNSTLKQLPEGNHNITVYATDIKGNTGASITKHFDIKLFDQHPQQNDDKSDSSIDLVVIAAIAVTAVGATFVIYHKKLRKHSER
ncbi:MAG: hypothetical protein CW716_03340 [Candidatus Bathyarchaeum sp.]|nr:MAG: hypothetical protein CW716_03340 [Candidatus Bathyarchaeum sp.]